MYLATQRGLLAILLKLLSRQEYIQISYSNGSRTIEYCGCCVIRLCVFNFWRPWISMKDQSSTDVPHCRYRKLKPSHSLTLHAICDKEVLPFSQSSPFSVHFSNVLSHACPLISFLSNKDTVQLRGEFRDNGIICIPIGLLWTSRIKAWAS